ncbi:ABC transporter substrate-binding protein [Scytonema sp. NUACC26]|uniref:ABC transporter substrate-binding protein n=1 Tax=Scytonema sp. NUACC26 TaxID=3140176 RepID=UPI0034DCBA5B
MLRGVAHVQSKLNCGIENIVEVLNNTDKQLSCTGGINGQLLQVLITNDWEKPEEGEKVAQRLSGYKDILGVIGHYSSSVTSHVADIYGNAGLVAISPGSTAIKRVSGKNYGLKFNKYIFRTAFCGNINRC